MRLRTAPALLVLAALGACQTYRPAPPRLDAYPAALSGRTLVGKPAGEAWSGADLLAEALAHNPQIAEAAAKYRTAQAAARAARVRPAATLTLTAEYSNEAEHWLYGAGSDVPLDYGVRRSGRLSAADLAALQALYDYQEAVWAVRTALAKAVVERSAAAREIALAQAALTARADRSGRLDRRVEAGEDARPAALAAHADLAVARHRLADSLARQDQAIIALARALGAAPGAVRELKVADAYPAPDTPVPASVRDQAALGRRDVLRAVADYDLAEGALRTEIARQYPEVHIGPGYTFDHGVRKIPFNLTLVLPPADLNRAAIAHAEAKRAEAGRSLDAVQANVLDQVDQAGSALQSARIQLKIARDHDLPAAERTASAAARSLRAGESDRVDELAARAAQLDAELAAGDAAKTARLAAIDLEDALRTPADPTEREMLQAAARRLGGGS